MRARRLVVSLLLIPVGVVVVAAQANGIREVSASSRSLIPVTTKIRYSTMILLPEGEEILDVVCGDRDFWVISATHNIAHVKPAKEGAATNLNLVAASGTVYSFLLTENKGTQPDLKIYVTSDDPPPGAKARYYSAAPRTALERADEDTTLTARCRI